MTKFCKPTQLKFNCHVKLLSGISQYHFNRQTPTHPECFAGTLITIIKMSEVETHNRTDRLSQLFQVCSLLLEKIIWGHFNFKHQFIKFEKIEKLRLSCKNAAVTINTVSSQINCVSLLETIVEQHCQFIFSSILYPNETKKMYHDPRRKSHAFSNFHLDAQ